MIGPLGESLRQAITVIDDEGKAIVFSKEQPMSVYSMKMALVGGARTR